MKAVVRVDLTEGAGAQRGGFWVSPQAGEVFLAAILAMANELLGAWRPFVSES